MMTGKAGKSIWMLLYLQQFRVPPFQMMFGIEVRFPLEAEKEGDSVIFADSVLTNTGVEDVELLKNKSQSLKAIHRNRRRNKKSNISSERDWFIIALKWEI